LSIINFLKEFLKNLTIKKFGFAKITHDICQNGQNDADPTPDTDPAK
jgi:hypothetical protein